MIVLDTTVLVYAVGTDHRLAGPCRHLVERLTDGSLRATTTVEVIQEFTHVRARRQRRDDAADLARDFISLLSPLTAVDVEDLESGLSLFETTSLGAFDAVLAAVAGRRGSAALVSADRAFADIPGVVHLDPGAPDFEAALVALAP